jgi:tRNA(fMet)-specific endonuclease VapC
VIGPEDLLLLDTNVLLYLLRGKDEGRYIKETYGLDRRAERPLISIITVGEMLSMSLRQAYGDTKRKALDDLLRELVIVDIRRTIAGHYAEIQTRLQALGTPIGQNDIWIAATAKATGAVLLTENHRHFGMIPGGMIRLEPIVLPRRA